MEQPPNIFEEGQESIPTPEEVMSVFEQLIGAKEFKEVRKLEDEKGLYLWDITISEENGETEYSYMRQGHYSEGQASATAIHVTFFDKEGFPAGGYSVAKFVDGEWSLTP